MKGLERRVTGGGRGGGGRTGDRAASLATGGRFCSIFKRTSPTCAKCGVVDIGSGMSRLRQAAMLQENKS